MLSELRYSGCRAWSDRQTVRHPEQRRQHRPEHSVRPVPDRHPDLYLKKYNTAIFVNGCFWHRHSGCKYAYMPKSRLDFWENKFEKNRIRDDNVREALANAGIRQLVIWECTIKKMKKNLNLRDETVEAVVKFLNNDASYIEF